MVLSGTLNRYLEPDTDTDVIIPAKFLKRTALDGFESFAFFEKRYAPQTRCEASIEARDFVFTEKVMNPACTLNHPNSAGATFLLTWSNFGCGSSREHAVYALRNYRVVIGSAPEGKTAFADIFRDNCRQNLIFTPVISEADHRKLAAWAESALAKGPAKLELHAETRRLRTSDGSLDLAYQIPDHHQTYILAGKDPFEMAKDQVTRFNRSIDAWFAASKDFRKSPDALKRAT